MIINTIKALSLSYLVVVTPESFINGNMWQFWIGFAGIFAFFFGMMIEDKK